MTNTADVLNPTHFQTTNSNSYLNRGMTKRSKPSTIHILFTVPKAGDNVGMMLRTPR